MKRTTDDEFHPVEPLTPQQVLLEAAAEQRAAAESIEGECMELSLQTVSWPDLSEHLEDIAPGHPAGTAAHRFATELLATLRYGQGE
ncbi:hypothetical protein GCM10027586_07020 [Kineococcus gypseus]|uniref:hypothetical protein n=1 Tax=Kineococcus gypseus TaxID=1637102 RepID=UPI003D7D44AF